MTLLVTGLSSCNQDSNDLETRLQDIYYEEGLIGKTLMSMDFNDAIDYQLIKSSLISNSSNSLKIEESFRFLESDDRVPIPLNSRFSNARILNEPISVQEILDEIELSETAQSYFQRIVNVVPDEENSEVSSFDEIFVALNQVADEFINDGALNENEIEALYQASVFIRSEIEGLVDFTNQALIEGGENLRCRFFCKVWRAVKSVVTYAVVGTVATVVITFGGALAALPAVAAVWGAFGVVNALNDNCVGKFSCLASAYRCSTGECCSTTGACK